jgi:hypothetical protein
MSIKGNAIQVVRDAHAALCGGDREGARTILEAFLHEIDPPVDVIHETLPDPCTDPLPTEDDDGRSAEAQAELDEENARVDAEEAEDDEPKSKKRGK